MLSCIGLHIQLMCASVVVMLPFHFTRPDAPWWGVVLGVVVYYAFLNGLIAFDWYVMRRWRMKRFAKWRNA
jgi:drug/metabolite transporter (DMT)-like permease